MYTNCKRHFAKMTVKHHTSARLRYNYSDVMHEECYMYLHPTYCTLARTKRSWLRLVTCSKDPYEDPMCSREKISRELLQDSLERIFVASYVRTFDDRGKFTETLRQRATFRATARSRSRDDLQGHALRRNINIVTMPTCDVLLRRFSKMMLYTESIRVAYSYLYYDKGSLPHLSFLLYRACTLMLQLLNRRRSSDRNIFQIG